MRLGDADKLAALKLKREELNQKYEEVNKKYNVKLRETTRRLMVNMQNIDNDENSRRRTIITSIRNIQLMVIEGYETYSTRSDFESRLKVKKNQYLELVLPRMPVSWVACPAEELAFEEYIERSSHRISNEAFDKYARLMQITLAAVGQPDGVPRAVRPAQPHAHRELGQPPVPAGAL